METTTVNLTYLVFKLFWAFSDVDQTEDKNRDLVRSCSQSRKHFDTFWEKFAIFWILFYQNVKKYHRVWAKFNFKMLLKNSKYSNTLKNIQNILEKFRKYTRNIPSWSANHSKWKFKCYLNVFDEQIIYDYTLMTDQKHQITIVRAKFEVQF